MRARGAWAWAMVAAGGSLAGLAMLFTAMQYGRVGLVSATISSQGAFASIYAAIGGESLHPLSFVAIAVSAVGTFVLIGAGRAGRASARAPRDPARARRGLLHRDLAVRGLARRLGHRRGLGRDLRAHLERRAGTRPARGDPAPQEPARRGLCRSLISGVGEVAAFGAYIAASDRIGVAVPAVIASQFALIAATVGWFVLGERLGRRQLAAAGAILAGVTALTILQA